MPVPGRIAHVVRQRVVPRQAHRNTADFDFGKALGETILAALYVVGLIVLLVLLVSATTATGQLVWGIAFGVAALPLLYWIGRVAAALIRPTGNTRQHRRNFVHKQVRQHPTDFELPSIFQILLVLGIVAAVLIGLALLLKALLDIPLLGALVMLVMALLFVLLLIGAAGG